MNPILFSPSSLDKRSHPIDMKRVAAIVLCGGEGTRLFPLTASRCKPALSVGGKFKLIDFPLSNAINSGCQKIFVLSQFLASSLHNHVSTTFRQDRFSSGFVEILSVEQKHKKKQWYEGTADAVRQNLDYFIECPVDYFIILSGDQLYHMDFRPLVLFAKENDADLVIASLPVDAKEAKRMGILKVDEDYRITDFIEKPKTLEAAAPFEKDGQYLGSMGIYLFSRDTLISLLTQFDGQDFGHDLIPEIIKMGNTFSYLFEGYWEDIGTIESFYNANLAMATPQPPFDAYNESNPIFTSHTDLPGPQISNCRLVHSIINEGSLIKAKEIVNSILGPRSVVGEGTVIHDSYLLGNEFYYPPVPTPTLPASIGIGKNCMIKKAIIDENVFIGDNVTLINEKGLDHFNGPTDIPGVFIRDEIIIVTRGATIPSNYTL